MPTTPRTSILTVVRYLLLDRFTFLVLPWAWAAFGFALDVVVLQIVPTGATGQRWVGGLAAVYAVVFVLGVQAVARTLPFALALGISRRTYFLGAATLAVALAVCFGVVVTVGQAVERLTGGWGLRMAYFRVPGILDGPWWQTWLTATAAFVLLFGYGMWYGLVHRRAGLAGTMVFTAAQAIVLAALAAVTTWTHGWAHVGHVLATTSVLPAILAGLAVVLLTAGLVTVRRLAV
ncbi:MAG TPA: hypothetical protein VGN37_26430 [Actinocatenispora sp.]